MQKLTFLSWLIHARCEKCESVEQPITSVSKLLNSDIRSLKEMISVGQTKVLKIKVKNKDNITREKHRQEINACIYYKYDIFI